MRKGQKKRSIAAKLGGLRYSKYEGRAVVRSCSSYCNTNFDESQQKTRRILKMSMDQMRAAVAALYSGKGWKEKVARMPEGQILAIYNRRVLGGSSRRAVM